MVGLTRFRLPSLRVDCDPASEQLAVRASQGVYAFSSCEACSTLGMLASCACGLANDDAPSPRPSSTSYSLSADKPVRSAVVTVTILRSLNDVPLSVCSGTL